jgi:hypothetical protein
MNLRSIVWAMLLATLLLTGCSSSKPRPAHGVSRSYGQASPASGGAAGAAGAPFNDDISK